MTLYQQWMSSSAHLKLFKLVAKIGFFPWLMLPFSALMWPWYFWSLSVHLPAELFLVGMLVLGGITIVLTISGLRYFPQQGAPVWISVEMRYGVIGVHIWKRFPEKAELNVLLEACINIAKGLRFKTVRIESPLFVKDRKRSIWGSAIRRALEKEGRPRTAVIEVPPRKMLKIRSLLFAITQKVKKYDVHCKHLPPYKGLALETAGFRISV